MILKRISYIYRSLTAEGSRGILHGIKLWRDRVRKRESWLANENMAERTADILLCPDLAEFHTVESAGKLIDGAIVMHNGLKVLPGSYCGDAMTDLFGQTKGIHEPQEEKVFREVLRYIKPGASMLELGAWWGFYSMWFHSEIPNSSIYMIEPESSNLEFGKRNLTLNNMGATFYQAYIGSESSEKSGLVPTITIDDALLKFGIEHLSILHCDIQAHELAMLKGAMNSLKNRKIDYIFISSHGTNLHYECLDYLRKFDYEIIAHADMLDTYSYDGLIAARRNELDGCPAVKISHK